MKANDIRKKFLKYFESKAHTILPSSPLVPKGDPTLLFTNAGMAQFNGVFLGEEKNRIVRMGEKDNFWAMGDVGPCGPCSEIIIDQGKDVGCGKPDCAIGCECDRFLELWNLVFMQYSKDLKGKLTSLPNQRLETYNVLLSFPSVLQGKKSNYDTDLFMPI